MTEVITSFPMPDQDLPQLSPLWRAAREGVFALPRCRNCGRIDWYPKGRCRDCGGEDIVWAALSGRGTLFSWTEVHRSLHKPLAGLGAYVSAIALLDEDFKTRFVTRLVDVDDCELRLGMPIEVRIADLGYPVIETGTAAPLFTIKLRNG